VDDAGFFDVDHTKPLTSTPAAPVERVSRSRSAERDGRVAAAAAAACITTDHDMSTAAAAESRLKAGAGAKGPCHLEKFT